MLGDNGEGPGAAEGPQPEPGSRSTSRLSGHSNPCGTARPALPARARSWRGRLGCSHSGHIAWAVGAVGCSGDPRAGKPHRIVPGDSCPGHRHPSCPHSPHRAPGGAAQPTSARPGSDLTLNKQLCTPSPRQRPRLTPRCPGRRKALHGPSATLPVPGPDPQRGERRDVHKGHLL